MTATRRVMTFLSRKLFCIAQRLDARVNSASVQRIGVEVTFLDAGLSQDFGRSLALKLRDLVKVYLSGELPHYPEERIHVGFSYGFTNHRRRRRRNPGGIRKGGAE